MPDKPRTSRNVTRSRWRRGAAAGIAVAVAWLLVPAGSFGQQANPPPAAPRRNAAPAAGLTPAEIQQHFDAYVIVQAQDALQLSDAQFPQFVARLKVLQQARRRHLVARGRLVQELNRMTAPRAAAFDEALVKERLRALADLDAGMGVELRQAYEAIDQVLDVRQQARFRVFEEQVERRKIDLLLRARQREPRRPQGPGGPPQRP